MNELGYILMHEHMAIDLSGIKQDLDCRLDCLEETIAEMKELYEHGVRVVVDVTNDGMGRNPSYVEEVATRSGIRILQSTGFYKEPFLPASVASASVEALANQMIHELQVGIADTTIKANLIGEIGTSKHEMTTLEMKIFDAAVLAHQATNAPISTHTTLGTYALEQVKYFQERQVDLSKVIIGHMDLSDDIATILAVLQSGVNIGFDTIGKNNYVLDEHRISYLLEIEKQGFLSQVVLSMDITRKTNFKYLGGIGYGYLFTNFIPKLLEAGMKQASVDVLLTDNPRRILGGILV